jgi:hypothetical protein
MSFPDEIERAYIMEKGILEEIFSCSFDKFDSFLDCVDNHKFAKMQKDYFINKLQELISNENIGCIYDSKIKTKLIAFSEALSEFDHYLICSVGYTYEPDQPIYQSIITDIYINERHSKDHLRERADEHIKKIHSLSKSLRVVYHELYESLKEYFWKRNSQSTLAANDTETRDNVNKKKIAESMGLEVNITKKLTADINKPPSKREIEDYLKKQHPAGNNYSGPSFHKKNDLSENTKHENIKKILGDIGEDEYIKPPTLKSLANRIIKRRMPNEQLPSDATKRKKQENAEAKNYTKLANLVYEKLSSEIK